MGAGAAAVRWSESRTAKEPQMPRTAPHRPVLEPAAAELAVATAQPPYLYQMSPAEGRRTVDAVQSGEVPKPEVDEEWISVTGIPAGGVKARIVRPPNVSGTLPVISTSTARAGCSATRTPTTGWSASWPSGSARPWSSPSTTSPPRPATRSPSSRTTRSPSGSWRTARRAKDLDANRIAVAGDSVGGNMTAALTLMAKERGDVSPSSRCCSTR
jgi:acetyl esterase